MRYLILMMASLLLGACHAPQMNKESFYGLDVGMSKTEVLEKVGKGTRAKTDELGVEEVYYIERFDQVRRSIAYRYTLRFKDGCLESKEVKEEIEEVLFEELGIEGK